MGTASESWQRHGRETRPQPSTEKTIVDIGAHIGAFAVLSPPRSGPAAAQPIKTAKSATKTATTNRQNPWATGQGSQDGQPLYSRVSERQETGPFRAML